jgi:ParB family chromosome partitioning protein
MTDTITIPLNRLAPWDGNVRRTTIHDGIDELAASIAAHGLLQSLVVRKGTRGKYEIVAGQRRYLALTALVKAGTIAKDHPVPCMLAADSVNATELSLAENVVRAPMHPADQFEAFRILIDDGATIPEVAARFGITETVVAKRLKLGRLSSIILDAYRNGDIGLEAAQAFAVTDDREAQERVFAELAPWNRDPYAIRRALTEEDIPTSDKRVRFVGVEAYQAAGGVIRQDLFSEDGAGYLQDNVLLDRLVTEKLDAIAAGVKTEGWRWVDILPDADYRACARLERRLPERIPLCDADQAEYDRLSEEYDALVDSDEPDDARLDEIESRMDALTLKTETWSADTLALAGAMVTLEYDGDVRIERGLVRKEDARKAEIASVDATDSGDGTETPAPSGHSPRLTEDLTAQKSAAIGAALMHQPDIALVAVVHCLALDMFYPGCGTESCLKLSSRSPSLSSAMAKPEACKGLEAIEQERACIGDRHPGNADDLWAWCLERPRDELLGILAFIAAKSVDGVQRKSDRPHASRLTNATQLAEALRVDMTEWFTPTAESYFARINRTQILAAIDEANGTHAPALEKLKKSELAIRAEQLLAGTSWLPEPLRLADNDNNDANLSQAAE